MATDWQRNGKRWKATKVRRKLGRYEHRGVAYYDRERMRQPLAPIVHPSSFDGYTAPPSWAQIPESWGEWTQPLPAGYFHQGGVDSSQPVDDLDAPPIAQAADYTLERCHVETACSYRNPGRAMYRWELTFADGAKFRFASRAIAEAALSELIKIRKAKHPRPKYGKRSPENDAVFFTERKLQKLAVDELPTEKPADTVSIDTAA